MSAGCENQCRLILVRVFWGRVEFLTRHSAGPLRSVCVPFLEVMRSSCQLLTVEPVRGRVGHDSSIHVDALTILIRITALDYHVPHHRFGSVQHSRYPVRLIRVVEHSKEAPFLWNQRESKAHNKPWAYLSFSFFLGSSLSIGSMIAEGPSFDSLTSISTVPRCLSRAINLHLPWWCIPKNQVVLHPLRGTVRSEPSSNTMSIGQ